MSDLLTQFLKDVYPIASAIVGFGSTYFLVGEFPQFLFLNNPNNQELAQFFLAVIIALSIFEGVSRK